MAALYPRFEKYYRVLAQHDDLFRSPIREGVVNQHDASLHWGCFGAESGRKVESNVIGVLVIESAGFGVVHGSTRVDISKLYAR